MKILLDTHIWIWSLQESHRLSVRLRGALKDPHNEIWLSPISTWEALMLQRKGRITFSGDLLSAFEFSAAQLHEAPVTHEIAITAEQLPLPHRDPADRFLAATSKVLGMTLATSDKTLLDLQEISTLSNR